MTFEQGTQATQLSGRILALARAGWVGLVLLALGLFGWAMPIRYRYLLGAAAGVGGPSGLLEAEEIRVLTELGLSLHFYVLYDVVLEVAPMLLFIAIAFIIFWRRSDDWMAMLVALMIILLWVMAPPALVTLSTLQPAWQMPVAFVRVLGLGCMLMVFYLFPDGRFTPGITRWLTFVWGASLVLAFLFPAALLPDLIVDVATPRQILILLWYLGWFISGVIAQIYRFRFVSNPAQRQQTKWIVFGFAAMFLILAVAGMPLVFIPALRQPGPSNLLYDLLVVPIAITALMIVPVCFAVAVLRYRLFDIDVIINRTLVYGTLSVALAGVYGISVVLLQSLFTAAGGQRSSAAIVLSTLGIAALFNPLRSGVQEAIDRRFYRRKYDAAQTLAAFAMTARDEMDLERLTAELLHVVRETMHPQHIALWLRQQK
jgi:hypothetical protein